MKINFYKICECNKKTEKQEKLKSPHRGRQKRIQIRQVPKRQLVINLWVLWDRGYRKAKTQNPTKKIQ